MGKASKEFLSQFVRGKALKDNLVETPDGKPALEMWHGGAPNIDRFDMSYMNTGEGAQMYSPGLYMAGRRGTSKTYRNQYTDKLLGKSANTPGGVIVGDIDLSMAPRTWARIQKKLKNGPLKMSEQEQLVADLTEDLEFYARELEHQSNSLDYKRLGKEWDDQKEQVIKDYHQEQGLAQAERDAESWGEASYEDEMELSYGPDWRDFVPNDEPDIPPSWGFIKQNSLTEDSYVHVTNLPDGTKKAEWELPTMGTRTFIYPAGTEDSYIWYTQEFDDALYRAERYIEDSPNHVQKYQLAWEIEPGNFQFMDLKDVEWPESFGGDRYLPGQPRPQAISNRRMTTDGRIIDMGSPEYAQHLETAIKNIEQATIGDIDKVAYSIYQGSVPKWNTAAYGPEPDFSALKGGLYKNRLHVNPDELLDWFEPISEQPKALQDLVNKYLDTKELLDNSWGADAWLTDKERQRLLSLTGQQFFYEMGNKFGKINFRDDMAKVGMPGMLYRDWTRDFNNKRPTYNVVMYDDKPIDILERGAASAPMLASVLGITSASLAAAALTQKPDVQSNLVLDPEIAEQFPLPENPDDQPSFFETLMKSDTVRDAISSPVAQHVGENLLDVTESMGMLGRVTAATGDVMYEFMNRPRDTQLNLEYAKDLGSQWLERFNTPYDQTMDEAARYVLKQTGSPALATGAYMGMFASDPSNWVGP